MSNPSVQSAVRAYTPALHAFATTNRLLAALAVLAPACDDADAAEIVEATALADEAAIIDGLAARGAPPTPLSYAELSSLLLGGEHKVTSAYQPNGVHAGIDFGDTGNGVTAVASPVDGTIIANTSACGKVAIFDGANTIILAHMSARTGLPIGAEVSVGTYLGKASDVKGGGCKAKGAHLHIEIRTGWNQSMAAPLADNTETTLDPLGYGYGAFPPVALLTPLTDAVLDTDPVWLTWSPMQGATTYRLQISGADSFTANSCSDGCVHDMAEASTNRAVGLNPGIYDWRVRAGNSGQGGHWSPVRRFTKI